MSEIIYITPEQAAQLIESTANANRGNGFFKDSTGFFQHCLDTGRISYEIAMKIQSKHPSLTNSVSPNILRVAGYMHDFSKIFEGGEYHEVGTAHLVLTRGDQDLGLISGGTQSERKQTLKKIASIILSDYALFEALGGNDYPNNPAYPSRFPSFKSRVEQLRKDLSPTNSTLTIEQLALPFTLNQQIGLYADLTNLDGERTPIQKRISEIEQRYGDKKGKFYDPVYAELTRKIRPRILIVGATIENLLK